MGMLVAGGCSEAATPVGNVSADDQPPAFEHTGSPDLDRLATFRTKPSVTIAWAKKWIGPEGGRLDFHGFAIEVPAGTVSRTTMFSIRLPVDPKASERVVAEFGPHGADFPNPIFIEFPYRNTSIESAAPTVLWWNGAWVNMGGVLTADGARVRTATTHFSTFGTSADRGGLYVGGGKAEESMQQVEQHSIDAD